MITKIFEDIVNRLDKPGLNMEPSKLKKLLQSALNKADLVSRDEFDAQAAVLLRTRMRLQALEQQLYAMEKLLNHPIDK